ncbi:MAG: helix-turn-helix domain-containing protein [Lachnospiraceae bacterium]|nr:helix-turn-helix domain-containing protein [Lachnospiraceae bacterium]
MVEINSGRDLKELLKERNLNVRKVSMMAGIRPSTLYAVVQQERKPSLGILLKLSEVLPIKIDSIKTRGLTGNSDASSNDLPLTEDAVRILQRLQPEKQYMIEKMIYHLDKMDDTGWSETLDMIRVLRKTHTRKMDTVSPKSVN